MRTADRTRTLDRSRGFSLVEVIIAGAILCGIVIMTALMLQSGNRLLGVTSAQAEAENRAVEQFTGRIRALGPDTLAKDEPVERWLGDWEQIVAARFVPVGTRGALNIPEGQQAVSVQVAIPPGVAGFIRPGDHVSVLAQLTVPDGGQTESRVQYLLQNVRVLAVGLQSFTRASESGAEWGLVSAGTLIVIAPLMLLFVLFQRLFIQSFTQSGLKG